MRMMRAQEAVVMGIIDGILSLQVPIISIIHCEHSTGGNEFRDRILLVVTSTEPVIDKS